MTRVILLLWIALCVINDSGLPRYEPAWSSMDFIGILPSKCSCYRWRQRWCHRCSESYIMTASVCKFWNCDLFGVLCSKQLHNSILKYVYLQIIGTNTWYWQTVLHRTGSERGRQSWDTIITWKHVRRNDMVIKHSVATLAITAGDILHWLILISHQVGLWLCEPVGSQMI